VSTLRYRADSTIPYAQALAVLAEHARGSSADFDFGPLKLAALHHSGLAVSGPDLETVARLLEDVPGLYPSGE
jgi:hypothetical protein